MREVGKIIFLGGFCTLEQTNISSGLELIYIHRQMFPTIHLRGLTLWGRALMMK